MAYIFDGPSRRIILSPGTTVVDIRDLYSRYKDWYYTGTNTRFAPFMFALGGEEIGDGKLIPTYLFLQAALIRPYEGNHTLSIVNGILVLEGGGDPIADTQGNYRVRINYQQPVQAIGYSTTGGGGATAAELVNALNATTIPVNVKRVNDVVLQGTGVPGNSMRPA